MTNEVCNYPLVFVHGMFGWGESKGINQIAPYWGATTGNIPDFLRNKGYECYAASVGPISSAWDQACELYAQLKGTRVDYGKAHSKKYSHRQFGREYKKPLFDGWGRDKKVHLIGHSFGGNVIRLLVHLLVYGDAEEISASGKEVSDLFKGGNDDLVYSVTAICTPLNGTAAYEVADRLKLLNPIKSTAIFWSCIAGRSWLNGRVTDSHLEQFGLTNTPGLKDALPASKAIKFFKQTTDSIAYDLSQKGANAINDSVRIAPNVYYFTIPFNAVTYSQKRNKQIVSDSNFFLLHVTSNLMLNNARKNSDNLDYGNDGLVDVSSACCPTNEPGEKYVHGEIPRKGVWNMMPVRKGDHGTPIGLFANRQETRNFYLEITALLKSIESKADDTAEKI